MRRTALLALSLATAAACADASDEPAPGTGRAPATELADSSDILYSVDGLAGPEAVRYDSSQDVWFVANFGEDAEEDRDANGFITRVTADGRIDSLRFMTGTAGAPLHMPRGMILEGDTLWVADVDGVHGFDRRTGQHLAFIDFTAHEPGFLNDVATDPRGVLYVTDTGRGRVYSMAGAGSRPELAVEDSLTGPPNGITWDPGRSAFLLAPWGGGQVIRSWSPSARGLPDVVEIPGGRFDGIELVDGAILVASQSDTSLWWVTGGEPRQIVTTRGRPADIGVDTRRGRVAVPYIALDRVDVWALPVSPDRPDGPR